MRAQSCFTVAAAPFPSVHHKRIRALPRELRSVLRERPSRMTVYDFDRRFTAAELRFNHAIDKVAAALETG